MYKPKLKLKKQMIAPFKGMKVVNLILSNKNFMSRIESDMKNSTSNVLETCIYPSDYTLAEFSSCVNKELEVNPNSLSKEGWVLLTTAINVNDHYFGAAYWNHHYQQVVIAHRGKNLLPLPEIFEDSKNSTSQMSSVRQGQEAFSLWEIYEDLKTYTSEMCSAATFSNIVAVRLNQFGKSLPMNYSLSITGFSLGGWLAQVTAFTTQYLTTESLYGKGEFFVENKEKGYHAHTVVFDCPGCKDMLLKMESDYACFNSKNLLDITIYLTTPNLVNALHSHLNIGTLYRVFTEDSGTERDFWNFIEHTIDSHDIDKIKSVFSSEKSTSFIDKIMKIIDWPQMKEGLSRNVFKYIANTQQKEYEYFRKMANCSDFYNPVSDGPEYCSFRYQVKKVEKEKCSVNIFTQSEFDFLSCYQFVKSFSSLHKKVESFSLIEQKTRGRIVEDESEEILSDFEIIRGREGFFIKCNSEEELQKLIICVKNILFFLPDIHNEIKNMLRDMNIEKDIYVKQSLEYLESIKLIDFKEANIEIIDHFLNSKIQFLQLRCYWHPVIGIKKIHKILENVKNEYKSSEVLFLNLRQIMYLEQFLSLTGYLKHLDKFTSSLLVVEGNTESPEADAFLEILLDALTDKPKIKFILVTDKSCKRWIHTGISNKLYDDSDNISKIKFSDLTSDSQTEILMKNIYFQGKQISLGTLTVDDVPKQLITEEILSMLINNEAIEVGEALPDIGDDGFYYINRTFHRYIGLKIDNKRKHKFYITYKDQVDKSKLKEGQDMLVISTNRKYFVKLCSEFEKNNVHWLTDIKHNDFEFLWQESRGSISNLRECISHPFYRYFNPNNDYLIRGSVLIISSLPGDGKSTILTKIAQTIRKHDDFLWLLQIDLKLYTEKVTAADFGENKDKFVEFLLDIASFKNSIDKEIFIHKVKNGKIALLLDGFDESISNHREKFFELLRILKDLKLEKLCITTSPLMRNAVEDMFSNFAYHVVPMSIRKLKEFFLAYWNKQLSRHLSREQSDEYAEKIIHCMQNHLEKRITLLHAKMAAETFIDKFKNTYSPPYPSETDLHEKLSFFYLYKAFAKNKFLSHIAYNQVINPTKLGLEFRILHTLFMKKYSLLALNSIFPEEDLKQFLSVNKMMKLKKYVKDVEKERETLGFISHVVNDKPVFTHQSFVKYFVAFFISQEKNTTHKKIKNFLREQVFGASNELLHHFFDFKTVESNCKLQTAVLNNSVSKVKEILLKVPNVKETIKVTDKVGRTALHLAAANGYSAIVKSLLKWGFTHVEDKLLNWTPLRYADRAGHWNAVELLLANGANAADLCEAKKIIRNWVEDEPRETLVHVAAKGGYINFLTALLKSKADLVNAIDENHCTPLHAAVNENVAELLIQHAIDTIAYVNLQDIYEKTPLHYVTAMNNGELALFLMEHGAAIESKDILCRTPLHTAAIRNARKVAEILIEKGADIEAEDSDRWTPLHTAAYNKSYEVADLLIKQGANINAKSIDERTPLHLAVEKKAGNMMVHLLKEGANPGVRDSYGYTPYNMALKKTKRKSY